MSSTPTVLPFSTNNPALMLRRRIVNISATGLTGLFALAVIVFFLNILWYLGSNGLKYINVNLFTQLPAAIGETGGGIGQSFLGSLIMIGIASVIGIPLGIGTALYLSEFGKGLLATVIRFTVDVLVGVPTIIFGLFMFIVLVVPTRSFSGLAGGIALGMIMVPIVTRTTEEVLHVVPQELREAALALGVPEWRMILQVLLPSVRGGIITGVILAVARISGEAAPIFVAALGNVFWPKSIFKPLDAVPLRIFIYADSPFETQQNQGLGAALVLILLLVVTSFAVRLATGAFRRAAR